MYPKRTVFQYLCVPVLLLILVAGGVLSGCDGAPRAEVEERVQENATGQTSRSDLPEAARPPATDWSYTRVRKFDSGMDELRGISMGPGERVYVAGDDLVRVFNVSGEALEEIPTEAPAYCATVDDDGNLWVGLQTKVLKYGPDRKLLTSWGQQGRERGELSFVSGIDVHGMNVLVADSGNRTVHRFDLTGDFINDIGTRDPEEDFVGIILPNPTLECHVDQDGTVHLNNSGRLRIEQYKLIGDLIGHWGEPGLAAEKFSGCCNPSSIALLGDGFVATAEKNIRRVKVYDPERNMKAHVGPEHFSSDQTIALSVAATDPSRLVVADHADGAVLVFERRNAP